MNRIFLTSVLALIISISVFSQEKGGLSYGVQGGLQLNTAILPDIALNTSIESVLSGDDVLKGVPQWADLTLNYKLGGFVKYNDGFGFVKFETQYTTTTIKKDIQFTTSDFWGHIDITLATLKEKYAYLDLSLSYNVYVYDDLYFGLGVTPAFLVSSTSKQDPSKSDFRVFAGLGYQINDKFALTTKVGLGLREVYKGSYIHHLMIPLSVSYTLH